MDTLWRDLRYGLRMLAKSPAFTIVAAVTLALAIGANTAVFTMLKGVVLRPLPGVPAAEKLVGVVNISRAGQTWPLSYPEYKDFRDRNHTFASLAASAPAPLSITTGDQVERVWGELVTGNYFQTLGVQPALGRLLQPEDDRVPGGHPVAVISHAFWERRFGSDPGVVGKTMSLGKRSYTIVGVAPAGFHGSVVGLSLHVFIPTMMQPEVYLSGSILEKRGSHWLIAQGRLKPGVSLESAQAEMKVVGDQMTKENSEEGGSIRQRGALLPLWKSPFGSQTFLLPILSVVMVVAGIVLLVACGNLANVMLARGAGRQREIAVRLALGAGRRRLVQQLLSESLLLSLLGGAGGILLSLWTNEWFSNLTPPTPYPVVLEAKFDPLVFGFALLICILSAVAFGLTPALQSSKVDLVPGLKENASTRMVRRSRLRGALVVWQMALSLVLLISAGLVIRSQQKARAIHPGFDPENVALASLDLGPNGYDAVTGPAFLQRLLDRVQSLPGVQSASLARFLPLLVVGAPSRGVEVEGYVPQSDEDMSLGYNIVTPGYFSGLHIRVLQGRAFSAHDDEDAANVVIVNETMARRFWPDGNPLGRRIRTAGDWREVVGVARDIKYLTLTEAPKPYVYLPLAQNYTGDLTLHVRTAGDPVALMGTLQSEVRRLDRNLPVFNVRTMTEHMQFSLGGYMLATLLLTRTGLLALVLASVGLYGVISYTVAQRTHEIGVRMALGARPTDVLKLVLAQGFRLTLLGVGAGLLISLAATRILARLLYGVGPRDPSTFVVVTLFLSVVAIIACYIPARRATRVDPMVALHYE